MLLHFKTAKIMNPIFNHMNEVAKYMNQVAKYTNPNFVHNFTRPSMVLNYKEIVG